MTAPCGHEPSADILHGMCGVQITSLFMHISPALVCWAWRWYPDPTKVKFDSMSAEQLKAYNTASWWDIGVLSMSTYMIWVVLYYVKVHHPLVVMFVSPGDHPLIVFAKQNSQSCSLFSGQL